MPRAGHAAPPTALAEIQGLYGAFSFPEKLLQKIWLRGDFDRAAARTLDGRRLHIRHPGKWNLLGGPDFQGARLRFDDGPEITGDIEVHLNAADWAAHGHARDRAYDRVLLHVVLFAPEASGQARGADGREIPTLVLLPLLHHALEEFAAEEAVENLAQGALARLPEQLGTLALPELASLLQREAARRWRQKVHFARLRIQRLGLEDACHATALEVLGYRFNRAPMLRVASRWPLRQWASGAFGADEAFAAELAGWSVQGVRPANHPRLRLRQYASWTRARPDWPERLHAFTRAFPPIALAGVTRDVRRAHRLKALRDCAAGELCAETIRGARFDTLLCDGLLPLLGAHGGGELQGGWFHWFCGDLPPLLRNGLRQFGLFAGGSRPACNGMAQGLLGWLIESEAHEQAEPRPAGNRGPFETASLSARLAGDRKNRGAKPFSSRGFGRGA